jgi:hypothetical protein
VSRDWAGAARSEEVRDAARGWKSAGAIDDATLSAIEAAYPGRGVALHRAWKVLIFLMTSIAILALAIALARPTDELLVSALFAVALAVATERLRASRLSGTGGDAATAFWAVASALFAVGYALLQNLKVRDADALTFLLATACVSVALAAWRWGFSFFATAGAAAFYLFLGRMSLARPAWIAASILVMGLSARRLDRPGLAPPHRHGFAGVFAVSAAALYAAVNLYSLDHRFIERIRLLSFGSGPLPPPPPASRLLAALATAVLPAVLLAWGIRARRTLLLSSGLAAMALSVATWRLYAPIGPRWAFLTACGAASIAAALWIHRRLRDAPGGAWRGLTAAPLFAGAEEGVSPPAALAAALVPGAHPEPERGPLSTGGGSFGGGGASGQY